MTADERPAWWRPGMSQADVRMWEAAERVAAEAPEIVPGSDVGLRLQPLMADFGAGIRAARAARSTRQQDPAA